MAVCVGKVVHDDLNVRWLLQLAGLKMVVEACGGRRRVLGRRGGTCGSWWLDGVGRIREKKIRVGKNGRKW